MKRIVIVLLFAISGCARQQPGPIPDNFNSLDAWQTHASNEIQSWVPLGTTVTNAQQTMKQHQFIVYSNSPSFLGCEYRSLSTLRDIVEETIIADFSVTNGKVSSEGVRTYLTGP